jgi:hypothetical protein
MKGLAAPVDGPRSPQLESIRLLLLVRLLKFADYSENAFCPDGRAAEMD